MFMFTTNINLQCLPPSNGVLNECVFSSECPKRGDSYRPKNAGFGLFSVDPAFVGQSPVAERTRRARWDFGDDDVDDDDDDDG